MTIQKQQSGSALSVSVQGRLDTVTAPQLEAEFKGALNGIEELTVDLSALEYVSSAGLRVLLNAQKTMNRQGRMRISGAGAAVLEIFRVTGFINFLNIE